MTGNADQRALWSDSAGPIWVDQREAMDATLAGVLDRTLARANLKSGHRVLDIGCGAGTSTLAVAQIVGKTGYVTGIDISKPLLKAAQDRALANTAFLDADAQSHQFAPESADVILSRFGVMFFEDSVAAFSNMAGALRQDGLISFSAWGAIAENPYFTLPAQIARQVLGPIPKSDPDGPGPFAFRNPENVARILQAAGLEPEIEVNNEPLVTPHSAEDLAQTMCHIGPANLALRHYEANAADHTRLMQALTQALKTYETDDGVSIPAQINYVSARIPS